MYRAGKAVLAGGPDVNDLIRPWGGGEPAIHLYEMALVTLPQRDDGVRRPFWFVFQPPTAEDTDLFYGFPPNPWVPDAHARVCPDFETDRRSHPGQATGTPSPRHVARVTDWVREHLPWYDPPRRDRCSPGSVPTWPRTAPHRTTSRATPSPARRPLRPPRRGRADATTPPVPGRPRRTSPTRSGDVGSGGAGERRTTRARWAPPGERECYDGCHERS